jgi:hypothetical protein
VTTGLQAAVGDRLIVHSVHVGEAVRDAEILEVRGADGGPPFLVRWSDTGHEGLVFPGRMPRCSTSATVRLRTERRDDT